MKKGSLILISVLVTILSMVGCSGSDSDEDITDRQYVFQNDTLVVSIYFGSGTSAGMQVFDRGSVCFSNLRQCTFSGQYPTVELECHDSGYYHFSMTCTFTSTSSFDAVVKENDLLTIWQYKPFKVPERMHFKLYNGVLDLNGDGVIDEGALP